VTLTIAITGGSGSGKTTIARTLVSALAPLRAVLVAEDDYYHDSARTPGFDPASYDFDVPAARDHDLLVRHLDAWRAGLSVEQPRYDFETHSRLAPTVTVAPAEVVVVEGIHALADPRLVARFDLKVFVDAPADVRVIRRLLRDVEQRGRTVSGGVAQYLRTTRPGHLAWTEPSRQCADIVVQGGTGIGNPAADGLAEAVDTIAAAVRAALQVRARA
jgi:uridine kinase